MPVITKPERELSLQFLGFGEDPFTNSADARFLYLSTQHGDVLSRAQRVIDEHRGLAVIEGAYGIGKTSVARRLEQIYRIYPDEYYVIFVPSASYESEFAALVDICYACGLKRRKGLTVQWRELERFLVDQKTQGRNVVMVLDDAEKMHPSALNAIHHLYNFEVREKVIQVILFGQPEVQNIFTRRPEVRSRVYSWFNLIPLKVNEAFELINFRCNVAGRKEPFLTQSRFLKIWGVAGGIPRRLVNICSHLVDVAGERETSTVDEDVVETAIQRFLDRGDVMPGEDVSLGRRAA
jgi:general secretion pathway protein A